mgnify:FL=1
MCITREKNDINDYIVKLEKENNKLKELYRGTCKHLFEIGHDELARYFQAQISDCPVWIPMEHTDVKNQKHC